MLVFIYTFAPVLIGVLLVLGGLLLSRRMPQQARLAFAVAFVLTFGIAVAFLVITYQGFTARLAVELVCGSITGVLGATMLNNLSSLPGRKLSLLVAGLVTPLMLCSLSEAVRLVAPSIAAEDTTERPGIASTISTGGNCNVSGHNNSVTCVVDPAQGGAPTPNRPDTTQKNFASDAEEERRKKILNDLAIEYDNLGGNCPSSVLTSAPADWTNKRLKQMGETWQVPENKAPLTEYSYNVFVGHCNRIDMHNVGTANADHNVMVGPSNEITVHDAGTANVQQNYMGLRTPARSGQETAPASAAAENH
jgi:hypothetical protein